MTGPWVLLVPFNRFTRATRVEYRNYRTAIVVWECPDCHGQWSVYPNGSAQHAHYMRWLAGTL